MKTYCIVCKKNTQNKNSKNGRIILKSFCSECNNKKFRFISEKNGSGLLSSFEIKTPLNKISLLNVLF